MVQRFLIVLGVVLAATSTFVLARALDDQNCGDFDSQAAAQQHLRDDPSDSDNLDPDNDGVACEESAYANPARDTTPVGQVGATTTSTTSTTFPAAASTTTVPVLPTEVAETGVFYAPLFGAGLILVAIGFSLRGTRAPGAHYSE